MIFVVVARERVSALVEWLFILYPCHARLLLYTFRLHGGFVLRCLGVQGRMRHADDGPLERG